MRIVQEPTYEVEAELLARLRERYDGYQPKCVGFDIGESRVEIERPVIDRCLKTSEEDAIERLKAACGHFVQLCIDFSIPRRAVNIRVLADDTLRTAVHAMGQADSETKLWGLIFLPSKGMRARLDSLLFIFLHELGHCWLDVPFPGAQEEVSNYEMFVNVAAMSALRRLLPFEEPAENKKYRDVVDELSYVAAPEMSRVLGLKVQRHIINKPESFLKLIWSQDAEAGRHEKTPADGGEVLE